MQRVILVEKPICDFCSSPDIVIAYLISDFVLPKYGWASDGAFAACGICMKLVEAGKQGALEKRALDTFIARYGRILPPQLTTLFIHELHVEFWKRLGKGRTYGDA